MRFFLILTALILCLSCCPALTEAPLSSPPEGEAFPQDAFADDPYLVSLAESSFEAYDFPQDYLYIAAESRGHVEQIDYITRSTVFPEDVNAGTSSGGSFGGSFGGSSGGTTAVVSDDSEKEKYVIAYLPPGYDDSDGPYDILYLINSSSMGPKDYLNPDRPTMLQNLLDHMIEDGLLKPLIVVAASFYPPNGSVKSLSLKDQVEYTAVFPYEMVEELIPQVEVHLKTYAASASLEDIVASRDHRGVTGFSLGGVTAWYIFLQQMQAFRWYLPISEASWDDGEGGTSGIYDSDASAQVLYNAVKQQGYGKGDFMLFVATGSNDTAFEVSMNQMKSLLAYDDLFVLGENTSCSLMSNGTHTDDALYTYVYHLFPSLFDDL